MAPLAGPSVGVESFGRGENIGGVIQIPLAIREHYAKCVTCVCVYMVTSGVTVWVSIVSGVWNASE